MAGTDQKLEALEDELKLLKGEVKRTLVDLRAIVMREDSPMSERVSMGPQESGPLIVSDRVQEDRRVEVLEEELKSLRREKEDASQRTPQRDRALEALQSDVRSLSLGQSVPPAAGQPYIQGAPAQPACQEMGNVPPYQQAPAPPGPPSEQAPQTPSDGRSTERDPRRSTTDAEEYWEEQIEEHAPQRSGDGQARREYPGEGPAGSGEGRRRMEVHEERSRSSTTDRRPGPRGARAAEPTDRQESDRPHRDPYVPAETRRRYRTSGAPETEERGRGGAVRDVYGGYEPGYWDQPDARESASFRDQIPASEEFLDVNLIANLVRWAIHAKRRVGPEMLMEPFDLYSRSNRHRPGLEEIIGNICSMVHEQPDAGEPDQAQEYVDLIHQLHGILAGGTSISYASQLGWGRMAIVDTKPFKLRVILHRIFVERPQVTGIPAWPGGAACYRRSRYIL